MATERGRLGFWKIALILGVVLLTVGVLLLSSIRLRWQRRLEAIVADIQTAGEPLSARELRAFQLPQTDRPDLSEEWIAAVAFLDTEAFEQARIPLPILGKVGAPELNHGEPIDGRTRRLLAAFFAEYETPVARLHELAEAEGVVRYPIAWEEHFHLLLEHAFVLRDAVRVIQLQAHLAAANGDWDEALRCLHTMYEIGDTLRYEPLLVSQLVRIAVHGIALDQAWGMLDGMELSERQLLELQQLLEARSYLPEMRRALLGERATGYLAMNDPSAGGGFRMLIEAANAELVPWLANDAALAAVDPLWRFNKPADVALMMELMTEFAAAFELPPNQAAAQIEAIEQRLSDKIAGPIGRVRYAATAGLLPAVQASQNAAMRSVTYGRITAVVAAALRVGKPGAPPATLEELLQAEPGLDASDPWTGAPLRYSVSRDALTIYSVGPNGVDDGGVDGRFNNSLWMEPDAVVRVRLARPGSRESEKRNEEEN